MRGIAILLAALALGRCSRASIQTVLEDGSARGTAHVNNVAIIGAGAAGSSTAYYLRQYAAEAGVAVNITVFERSAYIGGRSTTINAYNDPNSPLELGASIFVKINHILVDAATRFNLSTAKYGPKSAAANAPSLGIWDGKEFVLTLSASGPTWWDTARLLVKYGLAPIRTRSLMKATVGKFLAMYDTPIFPFESLTAATERVDLSAITSQTGVQFLSGNGIASTFAHDVVQASTRVNYAQNLNNFHGLETMVCMATDGAMAVEGGNWQIFQQMVLASGATLHLNTSVSSVTKDERGSYTIEASDGHATTSSHFDRVVIAAPLQYAEFALDEAIDAPASIEYVKLHVTIFTSPHSISPDMFNLAAEQSAPLTILTTLRCRGPQKACFDDEMPAPDFFSISVLDILENPVSGQAEYAYKIFSHDAVSEEWLLELLGVKDKHDKAISWIHRKIWHSYPLEVPRIEFERIELADNLYYTAGMESFISTMETNALMGKNIAKLIVDKLQDSDDP